jgi:RNA polymerase sigma-70 factor (ECF subfamily)
MQTDRELIANVQRGDPDAFTQLMLSHAERLCRFAYSLLSDEPAARDVVQDVFTAVWVGRAAWSPEHGIRTYLFGAVRNRALDDTRHASVRARASATLAESIAHSAEGAADPIADAVLERASRWAALRAALPLLTERRRTALRLRYAEQMTVPEVAQVMGVSTKAAEQLILQAIRTLRRALTGS